MQKFNANVAGSNACFSKRRSELESLIEQEGMPTEQFTLSAADNHQLDLNKIIYSDRPMYSFRNEFEKAKWQREIARDNLHLVDTYFIERVKEFIKAFQKQLNRT